MRDWQQDHALLRLDDGALPVGEAHLDGGDGGRYRPDDENVLPGRHQAKGGGAEPVPLWQAGEEAHAAAAQSEPQAAPFLAGGSDEDGGLSLPGRGADDYARLLQHRLRRRPCTPLERPPAILGHHPSLLVDEALHESSSPAELDVVRLAPIDERPGHAQRLRPSLGASDPEEEDAEAAPAGGRHPERAHAAGERSRAHLPRLAGDDGGIHPGGAPHAQALEAKLDPRRGPASLPEGDDGNVETERGGSEQDGCEHGDERHHRQPPPRRVEPMPTLARRHPRPVELA